MRALIAPGYYDYVNFPGAQLEIEATTDIQPHACYLDATAAHGSEARTMIWRVAVKARVDGGSR